MAQINLLKQKTPLENFWMFLPGLIAKLLVVLVLALVGYYAWQFAKLGRINKQVQEAQVDISNARLSVAAIANRDEIYTRQAQLQELDGLIGKHLYWSYLFPALAKVTLKQASYNSLMATKEGNIVLSVTVPNLLEMDKFIQVFDQPEFLKNFSNLRIGSFQKAEDTQNSSYTFDARMEFSPALLRAQSEAAAQRK